MHLRPAEPDDAMAVAGVHVRSWQVAYRGLLPDAYLDRLRPEDRAGHYDFGNHNPQSPQTIVGELDGAIHGFATTGPSRDADLPHYGELFALYVDPGHWGRGLGLALISAANTRLIAQGCQSAFLWILAGNARAERFYQADRWTPDGHHRTGQIWGVTLEERRLQRSLVEPFS